MDEKRKIGIRRVDSGFRDYNEIKEIVTKLKSLRDSMLRCNALGVDPERNEAYGNLSFRLNNKEFLCSATGSSRLKDVGNEHYTIIRDFEKGELVYSNIVGDRKPSVESSTHDGIYRGNSKINCIAHGHLHSIYFYGLGSDKAIVLDDVEYGSIELRELVRNRVRDGSSSVLNINISECRNLNRNLGKYGLIVPKNHFGGFFIVGEDIEEVKEGFFATAQYSAANLLKKINHELSLPQFI